ncbi:MAG: glycosyltransferase, partial [Fibrobacterota bacterium]
PVDPSVSRIQNTFVLHTFVKNWMACDDTSVTVIVPEKRDFPVKGVLNFPALYRRGGIGAILRFPLTLWETYFPANRKVRRFSFDSVSGYRIWARRRSKIDYYVGDVIDLIEGENIEFDCIVSHMVIGTSIAAKLRKRYKVPHIIGYHNTDLKFSRRKKYRRILECAEGIGFRSWCLQRHARACGVVPRTAAVVPSGIPEEFIVKQVPEYVHVPLRFLTTSALIGRKHIDVHLRALALLQDRLPWEYTILGAGPEEDYLEKLAQELGIDTQVHFCGLQPHEVCLEEMRKHDIYLQVSAPETLGMVYLEALAQGMAVIGTRGWGVDGLLVHKENGWLAEPEDPEGLADCIAEALQQEDFFRVRSRGLETIKGFTEEKACRRSLAFIRSCVYSQCSEPG